MSIRRFDKIEKSLDSFYENWNHVRKETIEVLGEKIAIQVTRKRLLDIRNSKGLIEEEKMKTLKEIQDILVKYKDEIKKEYKAEIIVIRFVFRDVLHLRYCCIFFTTGNKY